MCLLYLCPAGAEVKPFTFIHFSDLHIGTAGNEDRLRQGLADVEKNFPEAEFIIVTGDVTEFGYESEFTTLTSILKTSKIPVYPTMGNHDVRWSDSGKENYRHAFGEAYKVIDHKGVRFVLMDSSMLIEHYGHFDGLQLKRLEKDLQEMPDGGFAVLAMHHPPLSPGHFIDNEYQFADLISKYNVPRVCDGHGHAFQRYARNGTTYAMGGSVSNGGAPPHSYRIYKIEPDHMTAITRIYDRDITKTEDPVPTNSREHGKLAVAAAAQPGKFSVMLNDAPYAGSAAIVLDQISSAGLTIDSGKLDISNAPLSNGIHQLTVEAPDSGTTVICTVQFETAADPATTITRRFKLDSGNQSHPEVFEDVLYVGSNDGFLRAIDLADPDGKVLWQANLNSEVLSSPAVTTTSVIVGSMDSNVYCLDRASGDVQWKFKTNQAVLASPLVTSDTVYIGSGDKNMYALDLKTGEKKWSFAAEKLIKAKPALAKGRLFFGAWDNWFYSLDAKTGKLIWKVPISQHANGWYSAATSNPVISGDNIIFCSHDYTVRCLAQSTGGTIWAYKPEKAELGPSYSTAVIRDDVAYFGSINGHLVGHHVDTGKKVFDVDVRPSKKDDLFDSIPRLSGDRIYIGSVGGNVYCVNLPKAVVEWSVALQPGFIFTGPALWKDRVLVGSLNDMVYEIQHK
jgi:outer membrane protein assembly factor BamB